jgi:hypothetical protein
VAHQIAADKRSVLNDTPTIGVLLGLLPMRLSLMRTSSPSCANTIRDDGHPRSGAWKCDSLYTFSDCFYERAGS